MGEAKQVHLNGAYYGPSIPPPAKTYHRPGRGGGGCNPFSCCCGCLCSCLFNCIFQILFTLAIIVAAVCLIMWFVFRPNRVRFHVTDAALTEFNFTSATNTLHYDLALNVSIRNPNKRIGIYYDRIEARASYEGERFDSVFMTPFYQRHKNTTVLSPVFRGQNVVMLQSSEVSKYNDERSSGEYSIDLKLYLRIRFKFSVFKSPRIKPRIECDLKVPMSSNGSSSGTFEATRCGLDW